MNKEAFLQKSFLRQGFTLSSLQVHQFLTYEELLSAWNQRTNLTRITSFEEIVWKHFLDSVSVLSSQYVSRETWKGRLIDVGSGAGFPGIPLKILLPDCPVTLVDSVRKKVHFLHSVIEQTSLSDITAIWGRAEEWGRDNRYRETFDVCVSRAVSHLSTLSEYCLPFLRCGGLFFSYQSKDYHSELTQCEKAVTVLGGEIVGVEQFQLEEYQRCLICIRKIRSTPDRYPRRNGIPAKRPL